MIVPVSWRKWQINTINYRFKSPTVSYTELHQKWWYLMCLQKHLSAILLQSRLRLCQAYLRKQASLLSHLAEFRKYTKIAQCSYFPLNSAPQLFGQIMKKKKWFNPPYHILLEGNTMQWSMPHMVQGHEDFSQNTDKSILISSRPMGRLDTSTSK